MNSQHWATSIALLSILTLPVKAGQLFLFTGPDGLSAEVEFDLLNATTLQLRARNTSTGVPLGFSNSDQLLTSVSWDFGGAGDAVGDVTITGGTVIVGPTSASLNFDAVVSQLGPGADVSAEYGFGNEANTGLLLNFISGNTAHTTPFTTGNLDGPSNGNLNGPQAGLVSDTLPVALGGLGAIQDEWIATLTISAALANLNFLTEHGVTIEFGSDAEFVDGVLVPEPSSIALALTAVGVFPLWMGKRRRRA